MRLDGKVALVTGATRGLGRMTAIMMAKEGAKVAFTGRTVEAGRAVEDEIRKAGGEALFIPADSSQEEDVAGAVEKAVAAFGPITSLVNNAIATDHVGSGRDSHVDQMDTATLDGIMRVALYGTFWASKYALPHMIKTGNASIVNISASSSVSAIPTRPAYQASKGAINSLTRQMAFDYGKRGVRVNTIVVGFVYNGSESFRRLMEHPEMKPAMEKLILLPYIGDSPDIANGCIYLTSDESKFVTGSMLFIDGGMTCHQAQPATPMLAAERNSAD